MDDRPTVRSVGQAPVPDRRPPLRWLVVPLVLAAAVVVALLVREQGERRDAERISLAVAPSPATFVSVTGNRAGAGPVRLSVPLVLVNEGGRAVTVRSGAVSGGDLVVDGAVSAGPGQRVPLVLAQQVTCPAAASGTGADLELVVGGEAGERTVRVVLGDQPLEAVAERLTSLCGDVPAAVGLRVGTGVPTGSRTPLHLVNDSALPVRVLAVTAGRADVRLLDGAGRPTPLPYVLGPRSLVRPFHEGDLAKVRDVLLETTACEVVLHVDNGPGTTEGEIPVRC